MVQGLELHLAKRVHVITTLPSAASYLQINVGFTKVGAPLQGLQRIGYIGIERVKKIYKV